jgi:hypothetical protein
MMNHLRPYFGAAIFGAGMGLGIASERYFTLWKRTYRGDFGSLQIDRKDDLTYSYHLVSQEDGWFKHKVTLLRSNDPLDAVMYWRYGDMTGLEAPHLHYDEIESYRPIQVTIVRRVNHDQYIRDLDAALQTCPASDHDETAYAAIGFVMEKYKITHAVPKIYPE